MEGFEKQERGLEVDSAPGAVYQCAVHRNEADLQATADPTPVLLVECQKSTANLFVCTLAHFTLEVQHNSII